MRITITALTVLLLFSCTRERPAAHFVEGVYSPLIRLNGVWEISPGPAGEFRNGDLPGNTWKGIQVPGECMMQGFAIKHDEPFVYRKTFTIPDDFDNKIIKLRFDGVYSYSRAWINGHFLRDHSGGFTSWECDITPFIQAGDTAILILEVTDKADEISYGSGYAKHQIGGILRDVSLLALPANYPENISIETELDEDYLNATLQVSGGILKTGKNAEIRLELSDPENKKIHLDNSFISLNDTLTFQISNHVIDPCKWDAEHPDLYHLKVIFSENNKILWYRIFRIGFREVEVRGNKLLVNGREVKLRGVCRHDVHPLLGRVSAPVYELKDVLLAKEANINFIRTSHYPPSDNFLSLCDEYGLYVEDEAAVCFVGTHRTAAYYPGSSENAPDFTDRYLLQLEEMVHNHRNHPSVIIWSIGNENSYGVNFKKSYEWVKAADPSRPVMFSYPGKVPDSIRIYNILSMHYPDIHGKLEQYGKVTESFGYPDMPVIFDEWAHAACYNNFTLQEDPDIRDFWGIGLDSMWQGIFRSDGGAGGAIWGMIDETFMLPDSLQGFGEWWGITDKNVIPSGYSGKTVGYGEWGIIDTWRRKKPEFWNTKKAYSPVRLLSTCFDNYTPGTPLAIRVFNRFDHTNLNELTIKLRYKGREQNLDPPDLEPHTTGILNVSLEEWEPGVPVSLTFCDRNNKMIDTYGLQNVPDHSVTRTDRAGGILDDSAARAVQPGNKIELYEDENQVTVACEHNTYIIFSKTTGLITSLQTPGDTITLQGPFLNLRTRGSEVSYTYHEIKDYGNDWKPEGFACRKDNDVVLVTSKGRYAGIIPVIFDIYIYPGRLIKVRYRIEKVPDEYIREIGIKWILDDQYDSLCWNRESYWSSYPDGHLSGRTGKAALYSAEVKRYREEPLKEWVNDTKSFYYDGTGDEEPGRQLTNIARATKENIKEFSLINTGREIISVTGNGEVGCRLAREGKYLKLYIDNKLDYVDLGWGNYQRNILLGDSYSGEVVLSVHLPQE